MKKYLSLILILIICYISFWNNQTNALMACHTWVPNQFGNDVVSISLVDCCDFYPEHNAQCNFDVGTCRIESMCTLMDEPECNYEWGTFYNSTDCTNTIPTTPTCTITNGTWKFQTNYAKTRQEFWEVVAADLFWVSVCNPMPNNGDSCTSTYDSCKKNLSTTQYLECNRYDTWTDSCVVDVCDSWYNQVWNKCEADAVAWVCSIDPSNMTCTAGSYIDLPDSSTQYKWECSGLNGGQSETCSRTIPVIAENGSCDASHYNCSIWSLDSASSVSWTIAWTWKCKGTNGGLTASCSETKPITYTPPVAVWNWPTAWSTSTAFDDGLFAWMSPETNYKLTWCSSHKDEITGSEIILMPSDE